MKRKGKGKIHPAPPSPPPAPAPASGERGDHILSILNVLPSAILALALVLSLEDREVLAYMMTRSSEMSAAAAASSSSSYSSSSRKKKTPKKPGAGGAGAAHKPMFSCGCFDCYTAYWARWDSSANRELIHQAIEAFEDHLDCARGKPPETPVQKSRSKSSVKEKAAMPEGKKKINQEYEEDVVVVELSGELQVTARIGSEESKRLVRKVLPDLVALLNSRLWRLWNRNV